MLNIKRNIQTAVNGDNDACLHISTLVTEPRVTLKSGLRNVERKDRDAILCYFHHVVTAHSIKLSAKTISIFPARRGLFGVF